RHTRFSRDWSSDVCSSDLLEQTELSQADSCPNHKRAIIRVELARWWCFVEKVVKRKEIKGGFATQGLNKAATGHKAFISLPGFKEFIAQILVLRMNEDTSEEHIASKRSPSIRMGLHGRAEKFVVIVLVRHIDPRHEFPG